MIAIGITGRRQHAAAAIVVDGRVAAAVSEAAISRVPKAGYRDAGLPAGAIDACLAIAQLSLDDIDVIVAAEPHRANAGRPRLIVGADRRRPNGWPRRATEWRMATLDAHARLALAAVPESPALCADVARGAAAIARGHGDDVHLSPTPGLGRLFTLVTRLADALGLPTTDPCDVVVQLERLARSEPPAIPATPLALFTATPDGRDVEVDESALDAAVGPAHREFGAALRDGAHPLVRVQRTRAELAERGLAALAAAAAHVLDRQAGGAGRATVAGSAFMDADFTARVQAMTAVRLDVAPVVAPEGAALGAALAPFGSSATGRWADHLALGPRFTEPEVKAALENCRLDYVYEPSWPRLVERASKILARGKLVAWFHQAAEFSTEVGGSRSILADPSNRYARDNINRFLRLQPHDTPIGLSVPADAHACLTFDVRSPWTMASATVAEGYRDRVRAATTASGRVHAHVVGPGEHQPLYDLLSAHWARTGVPGLLNSGLHGVAEPIACSPRDAIRTTYSSAVDAMVMHRFLVMKDYWQMRTEDA